MPCSTCTVFSQGVWFSCGLCSPSEAFLAGQGTQSGSDSPQDPARARTSRALNNLPAPVGAVPPDRQGPLHLLHWSCVVCSATFPIPGLQAPMHLGAPPATQAPSNK